MTNKIIPALAAAMLACSAISCSLIKKAASTGSKDSDNDPLPEAVLPQDRVQIASSGSTRTYTPAELGKGVVRGDWAIESVNGKKAGGETIPYLKFADDGRVYGNNGCNVLNGSFKYNAQDSTLTFGQMISTMRLCQAADLSDTEINEALGATRYYAVTAGKDDRYQLTLLDAEHNPVMTLMHQNFEFLNGTWRVVRIDGVQVTDPEVCMVIDIDEKRVHGNTGCNIFNGTLETDMEAANSLSFQAIGVTRMACPEPNFQTQLIVALEDASQARPTGPDQVELIDSSGNTVLELERQL